MIYSLQGKVAELTPTYVVVEVSGIGYYVAVSVPTSQSMTLGKETKLFTQQIIREDAHLLFGFSDLKEKQMFNLLVSVSGVGPASAMIMLSSLELSEIAQAILSGNSAVLQKVKGIGAKTAQRIIVDLKDKVQQFETSTENISVTIDNKVKEESLSALEVLGIPKKMSERLADKLLKQNPELQTEDLVKQILKNI